jgi:hypothetical protein
MLCAERVLICLQSFEDQFPTIRELVIQEDDRLALLETRLARINAKLLQEKLEFESYIQIQEREITEHNTDGKHETHVFHQSKQAVIIVENN